MGKKGKKFSPANWQGRSKKQVEDNYKVMGYGCLGILLILIVGGIINTVSNLFF